MDYIFNSALNSVHKWFIGGLTGLLSNMMQSTAIVTKDLFWSNGIVKSFLNFSMWINGIVFGLAFLMTIFDMAEEAGGFKQINFSAIALNFIKGFIFLVCYQIIAQYIFNISSILGTFLKIDADSMTGVVSSVSGKVMEPILLIAFIVGIGYFMFVSFRRTGEMFIQIFSSAFYIPDVVRGDTTKIGDWLRQTIAIAFTYTFQYMMFFLGVAFLSQTTGSVSYNLLYYCFGFGMWATMPIVSHLLQKFGYSSGTKGGSFAQAAISQGISLLSKA